MHWKAAVSVLWNGSESWRRGGHPNGTDCCDCMDGFPLKVLQRQRLLRKYDFSTKCMRNERRSTDPMEIYEDFFWGVLWQNTACSVGTRSRTRWRNSVVLPLTSTGPSQTCWQILFLFMSFCFLGHTVYLFHIFIYFENLFLQVWDKIKNIKNTTSEVFLFIVLSRYKVLFSIPTVSLKSYIHIRWTESNEMLSSK